MQTSSKIEKWSAGLLFVSLIVVMIINRYLLFFSANMMVDSDQPFMWLGLKDYSEGNFYEPRFYGQDYNTFFESLVAVPLYKLGLPVYYALPIATHLIFLFPILFTTIVLFRSGYKSAAVLALCVFNCLPTAFDIMTSLPRGFVTGVFFSSFFVLSYLKPQSIKYVFLNGIMVAIGLFINPNMVLIAVPFFVFIFYYHYKNKTFYFCCLFALALLVPLYFIFDWFYDKHPNYVVYQLVHSFSIKYFIENINHLDQCFAHVSFFVEDNSWPLIIALVLLLIAAVIGKRRDALITILIFVAVLMLSLFTGKTREGSTWPYYSYSRMFIAVPFFFAVAPYLLRVNSKMIVSTAVFFTSLFCAYKFTNFPEAVKYHTNHLHAAGVRIVPIATVLDGMIVYKRMNEENDSKRFIISNIFWMSPYLTYGGKTIFPDFPDTEETQADHRYWVREYEKEKVFNRFMILSINYNFDKITAGKYPFSIKKIDEWGAFLIYNNKMKNGDFLELFRSIED